MLDSHRDKEIIAQLYQKLGGMYSRNLQKLLEVLRSFDAYPRVYHSSDHILDLCRKIIADNHPQEQERLLLLTAVYHDYVYDPKSKTNEEDSAEVFMRDSSELNLQNDVGSSLGNRNLIYKTILDTKTHDNFSTEFSKIFCRYDLSSFKNDILANEMKIRKEYEWVDWADYKQGKLDFLAKYKKSPIATEDREILGGMLFIEHFTKTCPPPSVGIYAGSFNPFHIGHKNIVEKAEKIFDKVVIARGINPLKSTNLWTTTTEPEFLKYRQVDHYTTSVVDYFNSKIYKPTLIRGLRNSIDLQAEIVQTRWLQELDPEIQVVNIVCDREFDHISSSGIRAVGGFPDLEKLAESYTVK